MYVLRNILEEVDGRRFLDVIVWNTFVEISRNTQSQFDSVKGRLVH